MIFRREHIGFDDDGIEADTNVRKMAYDNMIVIESPIRSPDLIGNKNTNGFNKLKINVGITTITE